MLIARKSTTQRCTNMTLHETKQFTKWLFFWLTSMLVVLFMANAVYLAMGGTLDDTNFSPVKRSGLKLLIDYKTGCQYLSTLKGGGIMARYAPDGSHMGCIRGLPMPPPAPVFQPQG